MDRSAAIMHPLQSSTPEPRRKVEAPPPPEPWRSPWSMDDDLPSLLPKKSPPPHRPAQSSAPVTPAAAPVPVTRAQPTISPRAGMTSTPQPQRPPQPAPAAVEAPRRVEAPRVREAPKSPVAPQDDKHLAIQQALARYQRRRMQRLMMFGLGVLALMLMAWYYTSDTEPPTDIDLLQDVTVIDAPESVPRAIGLLRHALESSVHADAKEHANQTPFAWDTPLLAQTLRVNETTLDNLRDLSAQDDWSPHHSAWMREDLGSDQRWDDLRVALAASTAYFARLNNDEAAMREAVAIAALARRLQSITAWPTFYARGVEMHQVACECVSELLRSTRLSSRKLALLQAEFESFAPSDTQLRDSLGSFYGFERQIVMQTAGVSPAGVGVKLPRVFFKPNQTLEIFAKAFRSLREEVMRAPYARTGSIASVVGPQGAPPTTLLSSNRSGLNHANLRLWPYAALVERQGLQSARHLIVLTSFAIRRYAMDRGALPQTLSDLMPNYFNDLPKDPFNGEPLHYDAARGLIYSVGMDYSDSGGHLGAAPLADAFEPTASVK